MYINKNERIMSKKVTSRFEIEIQYIANIKNHN